MTADIVLYCIVLYCHAYSLYLSDKMIRGLSICYGMPGLLEMLTRSGISCFKIIE